MGYRSIFRDGLFNEQVIIVSGGGTGIGRCIAHELASLGAVVVVCSRKLLNVERTRDEILAADGKALALPCDIRSAEQVEALMEQVVEQYGRIDGLVNNSGGQFISPAEDIRLKGWNAVIETNLTGAFLMCKHAMLRSMREHGGAIVNILMDLWSGFPGMAHSSAARAGVENLTKTLAVEWAPYHIRVNSVAPGIIQSSGLSNYDPSILKDIASYIPARRLGSESEVAAAVTFLLSSAASYMTGDTLRVDGASSLWRTNYEIAEHTPALPYNGFEE
ncbi:MAG TPA: SDR family oxidoreductase [Ktedonobacterales bacterium]|nr:SDR family oxidoreductase [Ktedonobacterales bacterium]